MKKYKYYIIRTSGSLKEIYGVIKETKKNITVVILKSTIEKKNINKTIILSKNSITKNLGQFDFTTNIE